MSAVFAAPGRVNLIGEHTDYNGGLCLPVALPQTTRVTMTARSDRNLRIASDQRDDAVEIALGDIAPGSVSGWAAYVAGVVWALREDGIDVPGMDLAITSDVPIGAGLSSSAALECAVALASCAAAGVEDTRELRRRLIAACIRAEREVAGAPTGGMDQTVSLLAEEGHALLLDFADDSVTPVPWPSERASLLVIDTRAAHQLSDGQYGDRRSECHAAASALGVGSLRDVSDLAAIAVLPEPLGRRARHVVTEIARVREVVDAVRAGDLDAVGAAFLASHASMRDDFEISTPELDLAVSAAVAAGAFGARMTGGGFGGSAVALVRPGDEAQVAAQVRAAFADHSFTEPGLLTVQPSAAARRLR